MTIVGLSACTGNPEKTTSAQPSQPSETGSTPASAAAPAEKKGDFSPVITAYLQIKNGLAKDDGNAAAAGGTAFVGALSGVTTSGLNPEQQKDVEDALADAKEMAEHIGTNVGKIAHQREHFEMLSTDMVDLMKVFKPGQALYKDFCPMYNDGKGATWVSETKEIRNPYLGSKMPTCGKMVEELK